MQNIRPHSQHRPAATSSASINSDDVAAHDWDGRAWKKVLVAYCTPNNTRGVIELLVTLIPFVVLWVTMCACLKFSVWLTLAIAPITAAFLVRIFIILHDCSHGAFFEHRWLNDWVGRTLGVLTMTPYDYWRRGHALHHATSGNLDRRNMWDPPLLTVQEYLALNRRSRLGYRLARNPLILFGILPLFLFGIQYRMPIGSTRSGWSPWISTMGTNLAIIAVITAMMATIGVGNFLLVHGPIFWLATSIGIWLIYIQHNYHKSYWLRDGQWTQHETALYGSSYYALPAFLNWVTGSIGVHHVHHLNSRIPYYRLLDVLRDHPRLCDIGKVGLLDSFRCARLALWDEERGRLVPFPRI